MRSKEEQIAIHLEDIRFFSLAFDAYVNTVETDVLKRLTVTNLQLIIERAQEALNLVNSL